MAEAVKKVLKEKRISEEVWTDKLRINNIFQNSDSEEEKVSIKHVKISEKPAEKKVWVFSRRTLLTISSHRILHLLRKLRRRLNLDPVEILNRIQSSLALTYPLILLIFDRYSISLTRFSRSINVFLCFKLRCGVKKIVH